MSTLHILWDESHIWGLLAVRALRAMEVPFRLVRGRELAAGLLQNARPAMLLVPGGNARHKAACLGPAGLDAVRDYVRSGGEYLGFCGGAGLALSWPGGLDLCPWNRGRFDERLQHFMSGHMRVAPGVGPEGGLAPAGLPAAPLLPVWWPGCFAPSGAGEVTVLAAYEEPGEDFWLADLCIASLPAGTFGAWKDMYGFSASPEFLGGQPCMVRGRSGRGGYVLSYSHLETPASPDANLWLAHLLDALAGVRPARISVPAWSLEQDDPDWDDPDLARMAGLFADIFRTGLEHGLLFTRNQWLMGWRMGIPGASLNNLRALLHAARHAAPTAQALRFWRDRGPETMEAARIFHSGCKDYLLTERLAQTLEKALPGTLPVELLKKHRDALFGAPMQPEGVFLSLVDVLDRLAFYQLQQRDA